MFVLIKWVEVEGSLVVQAFGRRSFVDESGVRGNSPGPNRARKSNVSSSIYRAYCQYFSCSQLHLPTQNHHFYFFGDNAEIKQTIICGRIIAHLSDLDLLYSPVYQDHLRLALASSPGGIPELASYESSITSQYFACLCTGALLVTISIQYGNVRDMEGFHRRRSRRPVSWH